MVKFCPKCGGLMLPVKEGGKAYLKCTKCGYKLSIDRKSLEKYKISYEIEQEKRVVTAKATKGVKRTLTPEEREMLQEYYEVFLESFEAEESGSSE